MTGSLRAVIVKLVVFSAFTLAVTGLLGAVIGNIQPFTDFYEVKAEFSDATGLLQQDVVKIAGVVVGKIQGATVDTSGDTGKAIVTLKIERDVDVPENARASIRFRNLLGQRMVVLERDSDDPAAPALPKDGSGFIPLAQTSPAFDLGVVFNNLQPVLAALDPEDVNTVSRAVVEIFRGREARVQELVSDAADLAGTLAERGPVVEQLVTELDTVVTNLASRDAELSSILGSFDQLLTTLAGRSEELGRGVSNLAVASNGIADLVAGNRPGLDTTIAQLQELLALLAARKAEVDETLRTLPKTTDALNRATTYGEWANLIGVCVNGICEPGFSSTSDTGLARVYRSALGGR